MGSQQSVAVFDGVEVEKVVANFSRKIRVQLPQP